jgi:DNA-binding SARP family transcriptional activator/TolB-like protein
MTRLQASLLGPFQLAAGDGHPVRIETKKARALLAVLLVAKGEPVRRERLGGLLWSRTTTRQSLASLSQALYSLRRALDEWAPDLIDARTETVAIREDRIDVDAWELDASCKEDGDVGRRHCLELYSGPFLDDLSIDTEEGFSEWLAAERARLEGLVVEAGTRLMESWERVPEEAEMAIVDRLLSLDPYNDPAIRVRMSVLARAGRPAAAIEAAGSFAATLSSDLGIAPSDALADLAGRIRAGSFDPTPSGPVATALSRPRRKLAFAAAAAAFVAAAAFLWATLARDPAPGSDVARLLVRPFEAGDGVDPELARGFSDDLSTELVRRAAIDVLSRESGRTVAPGNEAIHGASHVLRGRIRSEGGLWVLNVWITEAADGREVWAGRFSGSASAHRDVRDEILARITDGIGLELVALPEPARPTLPEVAVPAYLGALSRLHSGSPEGNAEALERFGQLVESHPDAIEAVAGMVVALERVAFEADDYAQAAGLHCWRAT